MTLELPKDLGGYQHIENGPTLEGDIWVSEGRPCFFVQVPQSPDAAEAQIHYPEYRIYRKIPTPSNRHDKAQWGEVEKAGFDAPVAEPKFYIPQDDKQRKLAPMFRGLLGYFPAALFEVASHSMASDMKHNPGSKDGPTWARSKSSDHADCIIRHLIDSGRGESDEEVYHLTAIAWRSLAQLQEALERRGAKPGISSRQ